MREVFERHKRSPQKRFKETPPLSTEQLQAPDHFDIDPPEKGPQLKQEIVDLLSTTEGLSEEQFVTFTDKMIHLVGGYGHKTSNGTVLKLEAKMGEDSNDSITLYRYTGAWNGADALCTQRSLMNVTVGKSAFPIVLDEAVQVFSYDSSMTPSIHRRLEIMIPSYTPKAPSITGEEINLFENVQLKNDRDLKPEALHAVARRVLSFYESTVNPPPVSPTE